MIMAPLISARQFGTQRLRNGNASQRVAVCGAQPIVIEHIEKHMNAFYLIVQFLAGLY